MRLATNYVPVGDKTQRHFATDHWAGVKHREIPSCERHAGWITERAGKGARHAG